MNNVFPKSLRQDIGRRLREIFSRSCCSPLRDHLDEPGTREPEHPSTIANGLCPLASSATRAVSATHSGLPAAKQLLGDQSQALDVLTWLHGRGVTVALDDFGTGHNTLSYLKLYPIDTIKLDRSFVFCGAANSARVQRRALRRRLPRIAESRRL
ncbi:MAG TPA: EAL domain-containing protein [Candidatus Dormibacteraeota bacterium]|nr:EAL domain-containing protein [Candidatus Dormibacteraeota bacterium]